MTPNEIADIEEQLLLRFGSWYNITTALRETHPEGIDLTGHHISVQEMQLADSHDSYGSVAWMVLAIEDRYDGHLTHARKTATYDSFRGNTWSTPLEDVIPKPTSQQIWVPRHH